MDVRVGIEYDRQLEPRKLKELQQAARPSSVVNWLHCEWFAGDPWEPVERFVVYEMVPESTLRASDAFQRQFGYRDEWLAACLGPSPRTLGHFDPVLGSFVSLGDAYGGAALIDLRQWLMFRRHRALALPVWIVQGRNGGHKRFWTKIEQQEAQFLGWEYDEPPAPGDLEFAPLDNRTIEALAGLDALRRWKQGMAWTHRTVGFTFKERAQATAAFRERLSKFMDRQIEDAVREVVRGTKTVEARPELVEAEQQFIHSEV